MRTLSIFLSLLFTLSLGAQNAQYVYPERNQVVKNITRDSISGWTFVEVVSENFNSNRARLAAYDIQGLAIWEQIYPFEIGDFIFGSVDASRLIDAGPEQLLYVSMPGVDCDIAFPNFSVLLINKADGSILDSYFLDLLGGDFSGTNFGVFPPYTRLNDGQIYFLFDDRMVSVQIDGTAGEFDTQSLFYPGDAPQEIALIDANTLAFIFTGPDNQPFIRRVSLDGNDATEHLLPTGISILDMAFIRNQEQLILRTDSELYRYDFTLNQVVFLGNSSQFSDLTLYPDAVSGYDAFTGQYYRYLASSGTFLSDTLQEIISDKLDPKTLNFTTAGTYLLGGKLAFGDGGQPNFGFWTEGSTPLPRVQGNGDLTLNAVLQDTVVNIQFSADLPNPSLLTVDVPFSLEITNNSLFPINELTVEFDRDIGFFFCERLENIVRTYNLPLVPAGATYTLSDTVTFQDFFAQEGVHYFTFNVCIGRPNGLIDTNFDNCLSSPTITVVISGINDPKIDSARLTIIPNPTSDLWQIGQLPDWATGWSLHDLSGRTLRSGVLSPEMRNGSLSIPGQDLSTGVYLLRLRGAQRPLAVRLLKF